MEPLTQVKCLAAEERRATVDILNHLNDDFLQTKSVREAGEKSGQNRFRANKAGIAQRILQSIDSGSGEKINRNLAKTCAQI